MKTVMTVLGEASANDLGRVLMHEHLQCNLLKEYREAGLINQNEVMVEELARFRSAGGKTIVDLSSSELTKGAAPDPLGLYSHFEPSDGDGIASRSVGNIEMLRRLAEDSGVNVIVGVGHYRDPYLDRGWVDSHSVKYIADGIVEDIRSGIGDTGVRPGIIGEVGADKWYISALEERCLRAAAVAARETGLTLSTHAARWPVGVAQLDLLQSEGIDASRVIIGHCDSVHIPEYHLDLAKRGVFVQFDLMHGKLLPEQVAQEAELVMNMVRAGYLNRILLSHDVCLTSHLHWGGGKGYDFILTEFWDALRERGLSDAEIDTILVDNAASALTGM